MGLVPCELSRLIGTVATNVQQEFKICESPPVGSLQLGVGVRTGFSHSVRSDTRWLYRRLRDRHVRGAVSAVQDGADTVKPTATLDGVNTFVSTAFPGSFAFNIIGNPAITLSNLTDGWSLVS